MRTLKFRAWDNVEQCWVKAFSIPNIGWQKFDDEPMTDIEIEQFTGLKDKNGKEIYEGDIVNLIEQNGAKDIVSFEGQDCFVVNFDRGCFVLSEIKELLMSIGSYLLCDIEVVGNIHENPELI